MVFDALKELLIISGFTGPLYWSKFNAACDGKIQSPINSMLLLTNCIHHFSRTRQHRFWKNS